MKQFSLIIVTIIFIYHQVNAQSAVDTAYERPPTEDERITLSGMPVVFVALEPSLNYERCDKTCETAPRKYPSYIPTRYNGFKTFNYYEKFCNGHVEDCITAKPDLKICFANSTSKQFYDWLERGNNYENPRSCPEDRSFNLRSWLQFPFKCDICICKCIPDYAYVSDIRALCFKTVLANLRNNKVVTNLKFVETEGMIQIQIEEGEIKESNGILTTINSAWAQPRKVLLEPHYYNNYYEATFVNTGGSTNGTNNIAITPTPGIIYTDELIVPEGHELSIMMKRGDYDRITLQDIVYLDDVIVPDGHVVTGVRIRPVIISNETRAFRLEVRATQYDFSTHQLINKVPVNRFDNSMWVFFNQKIGEETRTEYKLEKDGSDSLDVKDDLRDSLPHQYVKIRNSGLTDDGGQSIIPCFDKRPTILESGPLRGVGLYVRGYGTIKPYLTLKPIPYNE